jgi:hypothetical protein
MSHAAIDQIDWETLDALADDYESVEQIQKLLTPKVVSQEEIIDRLERLYRAGYVFLTLGKTFDRDALVEEIYLTKDRKFWFGHTQNGVGPNKALGVVGSTITVVATAMSMW